MLMSSRSVFLRVGRIPDRTTSPPHFCAASRAFPRSSPSCHSMSRRQEPPNTCGSRLNSRLNRASSVVKWESSNTSRTSVAIGAGTPEMIDQKEFLLGADAPDTGFETLLFEHLFKGAHVLQEVPEKDPDLLGPRLFTNVLLTHSRLRDSFSLGRYCTPCARGHADIRRHHDSPHNAVGASYMPPQ